MNLMKFHKSKSKVLHLDQTNPKCKLTLEWIERNLEENDLGVLVHEKLNMRQEYAPVTQKAKHLLGCIKRSATRKFRERTFLFCSGETPSGVLNPALGLSTQEEHGHIGASPNEGTKINKGEPLL